MNRCMGVLSVIQRHSSLRTLCLLLFLAGLPAVNAFGGESKYNPKPVQLEAYQMYCFAAGADHTAYVTPVLQYASAADPFHANQYYTEFLSKKYGVRLTSRCQIATGGGVPQQKAEAERMRQIDMDNLRRAGCHFVDVDWTPPRPASKTQPKPAAVPNASASWPATFDERVAINGVYVGTYACAKGPVDLRLTLSLNENSILNGTFTFYLPPGSHTKSYTFSLGGPFDPASGKFNLYPSKWESPAPPNYMMVGLKGEFDPQGRKVSGIVNYTGCGRFEAMQGRED